MARTDSPSARPSRRFTVPMVARNSGEQHRVSTPLELLFDLTFVAAVAQAARELAHYIADDHPADAIVPFLMVFFAIWWAWVNFTWFASAFDTDDVPYRLLTLVQMAGVLVLAAGVPDGFEHQNFTTVVIGYLIMRVALITQWLRAARGDPEHRTIALRYVGCIATIQVLWVLRLFLPGTLALAGFVPLALLELAAPYWAEGGRGGTPWHPHHIAERYSLFTIIVLGESVTAAVAAVQTSSGEGGWSLDAGLVFSGGLLTMFGLWWIYSLKEGGVGLERNPGLAFWWGYGHYGVFAALAALGAGLEVAAESTGHHVEAPDPLVAFAVAIPVAVVLVMVWALHVPLGGARRGDLPTVLAAVLAVLAIAAAVGSFGLALPLAILLISVPPGLIVLTALLAGRDPSLHS